MLLFLLIVSQATAQLIDLTGTWTYLSGGIPGKLQFSQQNSVWGGTTSYDSFSQYYTSPGPTVSQQLSNINTYYKWGLTYLTFSFPINSYTTQTYFMVSDFFGNNFNGLYIDNQGNTGIVDATRGLSQSPPLSSVPLNPKNFSTVQNGWPGDLILNAHSSTPGVVIYTAQIHDNSLPLPAIKNDGVTETMQNVKLYSNYYGRFLYYERGTQYYFGLFDNFMTQVNGQFMAGSSSYAFNGAVGSFGQSTGTSLPSAVLGCWYSFLANGWAGYLMFWMDWSNNQILGQAFFDSNRFDLNPTPPDPNNPEYLSGIHFLQTHFGYSVTFQRSNGQVYYGIWSPDFSSLRGHFTSGNGVYSFDAILTASPAGGPGV